MMRDLPKIRDSISFIYFEYGHIEKSKEGIQFRNKQGIIPINAASLSSLLLGPGTTTTHGAIKSITSLGCSVIWCGEGGVRCYAQGIGETMKSNRLQHQARLASDPSLKIAVIRKMYLQRFKENLPNGLTLEQIRGREGIRVRKAYEKAAKENGITWEGRKYNRHDWKDANLVNRLLSTANSCLHGFVHAAILSSGYSPALGFIHQGKKLSFVFDIADLYKTNITVPVAFKIAADHNNSHNPERRVRKACRDLFFENHLVKNIVNDIDKILYIDEDEGVNENFDIDADPFLPTSLAHPKMNQNGNHHS